MKYLYLAQLEAVYDAGGAAPVIDFCPALLVASSEQDAEQQARARCAGFFSEMHGWRHHAVTVMAVPEETLLQAGYQRKESEKSR
jgi:hypothetical protein